MAPPRHDSKAGARQGGGRGNPGRPDGGPIVGERGVSYGLQIPTRPPASSKQQQQRNGQPKYQSKGVFGDESSSDSESGVPVAAAAAGGASRRGAASSNLVVGKMIARQMAAMGKDAKTKAVQEEALKQDAGVFDYDAHVDAIQGERRKKEAARQEEKVARQSKYIAGLMETAAHRKKEQDVLLERRLEKEREAEEAVYGTKEKFVTGAYRRKLEEDEKWKLEQVRKQEEDEANAVEKKRSMAGFYSNYVIGVVGAGAGGGVGEGAAERAAGSGGGDVDERAAPRPGVEAGREPAARDEEEKEERGEGEAGEAGAGLPPAKEVEVEVEDPVARAARIKREREEKIAKAKARYAERSGKRQA